MAAGAEELALCVVGEMVDLRWTAATGGDGEWYEAQVKTVSEERVVFTYMQSSDYNAFDEVVAISEIGPQRVRPLTKRRSKRSKKALQFTYADLESGLVMRRKDSAEFSEMLLSEGRFEPDTVPRIDGSTLSVELLRSQGFREPMIAKPVSSIPGMVMPAGLTVEKIAELVGPDVIMPVLDVGPQEEVSMSLEQWVEYWNDPARSRRLNVTSLEITGTELAKLTQTAECVRQLDWIDNAWPAELKAVSMARLCGATSKFGVQDTALEINTTDFAIDPCGAYKNKARWATPQSTHGLDSRDDAAKVGSPPAKRFKSEAASLDAGAGSKACVLETPVMPNRREALLEQHSDVDGQQEASEGAPSKKTALGFVHKRPEKNLPNQQLSQTPTSGSDAASAAAAEDVTSDTTSSELPDYGAWVIYQDAKQEGEQEHAQRLSTKALARAEAKKRREDILQRQDERKAAAGDAARAQVWTGFAKRADAAKKILEKRTAVEEKARLLSMVQQRQTVAPVLPVPRSQSVDTDSSTMKQIDKLAEFGGKPHASWQGKKGAGPLPPPTEVATWTRESQQSFYSSRIAYWKRQTMNTCLQACSKRRIFAGGDAVFLRDRLVRWEYGGPALLEFGETIAPEFPAPQGARALPAHKLPMNGMAVEIWSKEGKWYKCTIVAVQEGTASDQEDDAAARENTGAAVAAAVYGRVQVSYDGYIDDYNEWLEWPRQAALLRKRSRTAADNKMATGTAVQSLPSPPSVVRAADCHQKDIDEQTTVTQRVVTATGQTLLTVLYNSGKLDATANAVPDRPGNKRKNAARRLQALYFGARRLKRCSSNSSPPMPSSSSSVRVEVVAVRSTNHDELEDGEPAADQEQPALPAPDQRGDHVECTDEVKSLHENQRTTASSDSDEDEDADEREAQQLAEEEWQQSRRGARAVRSQVETVVALMVRAVAKRGEEIAAEKRREAAARKVARRAVPRISQKRRNLGIIYPKVQVYVLMGTAGSYTDFHIDFGGTSVWYHIVSGAKIFYVLPPTKENLRKFEDWSCSPSQSALFFPDVAPGPCMRVHLQAGDTFLIPPGWIHGVYTPVDSIVFGGNFLHSLNIGMQLKIYELEKRMGVPQRQQFPFFEEMHWFVALKYVRKWRSSRLLREAAENAGAEVGNMMGLTAYELCGLQDLAASLSEWKDHQGPKQPDIPDAVKDSEGGTDELLADLFAMVTTTAKQFTELELKQAQWFHGCESTAAPRSRHKASKKKQKRKR